MQPIGNYLPDFGKKHYHSDERFALIETALIEIASELKRVKDRLFKLENKGQCE